MDGDASDSDDGRAINFKGGRAGRKDCSERLIEGRFRWKVKPEPFGQDFPQATYIEDWKEFEGKARDELWGKIRDATYTPVAGDNSDEVEFAEFSFHDSPVRCERFLLVDQDAKSPRKPCDESQIVNRWMKKLEDFNRENPCPPEKAIQYTMAERYTSEYLKRKAKWEKTGKGPEPTEFKDPPESTKHYKAALGILYPQPQPAWSTVVAQFDATSAATAALKGEPEPGTLSSVLKQIVKKWSRWLRDFEDQDLVYLSKQNKHLVDQPGFLRVIPESSIYIALDCNDKVLIYLDPVAVERTFGKNIKDQMERDTKDLYDLKPPTRAKNVRTTSQQENEERNGFEPDQCGVDHLGHWNETGRGSWAMFETKETDNLPSYLRQLVLYYMESTGGTITRLLDYQFGILEPDLRAAYRAVYRESPKFAKLPPTNGPRHEETYCLRAYLINMHTDQHKDAGDWKGGLTGIAQLGDFEGKGMVFKELGIILPGYGSGAAMQFRGTIFKHFIGQWTGKCRYAFDHTTHETVRKAAEILKQKREDGKSSIKFDPDAPEIDKKDDKNDDKKDDQKTKPKPKRRPKAPAASSTKGKTKPASSSKPDENDAMDDTPEPPAFGKRKRSPTSKPDTDGNLGSPLPTRAAKKVKTADGAAAAAADKSLDPQDEATGIPQTVRQVVPQRPKRATRGRVSRKR